MNVTNRKSQKCNQQPKKKVINLGMSLYTQQIEYEKSSKTAKKEIGQKC